jgi:SAM-dependent methyltransferase
MSSLSQEIIVYNSPSAKIKKYEMNYMLDYDFEKIMVWARQKYLESLIRDIKPGSVLEIGCGYEQLFERVADVFSIQKWTIIEPSEIFYTAAREKMEADGRVEIIRGFAEEVVGRAFFQKVELCICSSLLHEVEQPEQILRAAKESLCQGGMLHVNVPNATSFHRLLACEMGLISSPYQLSERNVAMLQHRVYDADALSSFVEKAGLAVKDAGGWFIKPFTHSQMEKMIEYIGGNVLDGLWQMGAKFPALASEIFVNAVRSR